MLDSVLQTMQPSDWIGFVGVFLLLLAFVLNIVGKVRGDGIIYSALNALGAGIACYASWLISFLPFVLLEGVWFLVSCVALVQVLRRSEGYSTG